MSKMKLRISDLTIDGSVLPRICENQTTIDRYAELQRTKNLPPPVVFCDGTTRWLADGKHRIRGLKRIGETEVVCDVRKGSKADAIWYAAGANQAHGLPLTADERRNAAELILTNSALRESKGDEMIADQCGVHRHTVLRKRQALEKSKIIPSTTTRTTRRSGSTYIQDVSSQRAKRGRTKPRPPDPNETDLLGANVPAWASQIVADTGLLSAAQTKISELIENIEGMKKLKSRAGKDLDVKGITHRLKEAHMLIGQAKCYVLCPDCRDRGRRAKTCEVCCGVGWLNKEECEDAYLA